MAAMIPSGKHLPLKILGVSREPRKGEKIIGVKLNLRNGEATFSGNDTKHGGGKTREKREREREREDPASASSELHTT